MPPWLTRRAASSLGLAVALCASGAWLFEVHSHLTFVADDWALLVGKQGSGLGYVLDPFNENILVGPALLYRLLMAMFGIDSAAPYFAVATALFLTSAGLLFVLLRRRIDDWLALLGAVSILFLGAAFEDLLWAFQVGYFGSMVAGLATMIALEKESERADALACVLLAASIAFSSLGLSFMVAAGVSVASGRRPRLRRVYVPLAPLAFYLWWWLVWGHTAESSVSFHNVEHLLPFVYNTASAGITSLLGLATGDGTESSQPHLIWGQLLLGAFLLMIAIRIFSERRLPRGLAVALALGVAFWVSVALVGNPAFGRFPTTSRYQYISAIFLLLIAAETIGGYRIPRLGLAVGVLLTGFALYGGIHLLEREYEERWRPSGEALRANLAAVDMAGANVRPSFKIVFPPKPVTTARKYLDVAQSFGSPGYSPQELAGRSESNRSVADLTLAQALGLALEPPDGSGRNCQTLDATASGVTGLTPRGGFTFENRSNGPVEPMLARFADGFSVFFGSIEPGAKTSLRIPADGVSRPWRLGLRGSGPVRLCVP